MRLDEYNVLKKVLSELRQEYNEIEEKIKWDKEKIIDIEARLQVFRDAEPEDVKVFSPRTLEVMHREEIAQIREEKSAYEERDREWTAKKEFLAKYISIMEGLLKGKSKSASLEKESAEEVQDTVIKNLDQLAQKIDQSSSGIMNNPVQAKQDLAVISQCLRENIDRMRDTVWI